MISNKYVDEYIHLYKTGEIKLNKERIMLIEYLQKYVLVRDDIYFNEELIENYIKLQRNGISNLNHFKSS